jgi:hypothetical protein
MAIQNGFHVHLKEGTDQPHSDQIAAFYQGKSTHQLV